jgi:hypothetical protein
MPKKNTDLLGIAPVAEAVNTTTQAVTSGAAAFLSRICLPAAEEFGLLLRDRVSAWRTRNLENIARKAEQKLKASESAELHAPPRVIYQIVELGSWTEEDEVQDMWAGLLASSCNFDGDDDSNLMFIDYLSRLSVPEVKILHHACQNAPKFMSPAGWVYADDYDVTLEKLMEISGISDAHRLDRELDHLCALGLLSEGNGFYMHSQEAGLTPSPLALQMWVRCQGHRGNPTEFLDLIEPDDEETGSSDLSDLPDAQ